MLNVDNTIVDRIEKCDGTLIDQLHKDGIATQNLSFNITNKTAPKFIGLYEKIFNNQPITDESDYMRRMEVKKINEQKFQITECLAIRPSASLLIEKLKALKMPVTILLTSRNDDERTKNLHKNLKLQLAGKKFNELTTFIPRDWFRLKPKGAKVSVKSAIALRKHYTDIKPNDFVILLDHLDSARFIKGDDTRDLNIVVSMFTTRNRYDKQKDAIEVEAIIEKIMDFVGLPQSTKPN